MIYDVDLLDSAPPFKNVVEGKTSMLYGRALKNYRRYKSTEADYLWRVEKRREQYAFDMMKRNQPTFSVKDLSDDVRVQGRHLVREEIEKRRNEKLPKFLQDELDKVMGVEDDNDEKPSSSTTTASAAAPTALLQTKRQGPVKSCKKSTESRYS